MTMESYSFIFGIGFLIHVLSAAAAPLETVWLNHVTTTFLTGKRTLSDTDLLNELTFVLTRRSETLTLNLRRNHDINPNPNFYFARKLKNGQSVLVKAPNVEKEDVAYYQDIRNGAFVTARCVKKSNEECDITINGNIRIGDRDYNIGPAETDIASRNFLADPGPLGRQYVLEEQLHTQRKYSMERKGAVQENDISTQQTFRSLLRRFEESSRNASTLHNRAQADKSRDLLGVYYVKLAVLIEPGLWDFYSSTAHSSGILTRSRNARKRIKEIFSHVMNGVNMIYSGIEDNSISIRVFLHDFIIFKKKSDFPHNVSKVVRQDGVDYIDVNDYHDDIVIWDKITEKRSKKSFGHGMLFTRYKLYDEEISEEYDAGGVAYIGDICMVGRRMSLVESGSLLWMVHGAAHELGHNLGAFHDGEEGALTCRAEDLYIMSFERIEPKPGLPYTKNPWLFSNCSLSQFKIVLNDKNKTCLGTPGPYYNHEEYTKHVMKQAGEAFTLDEQCELILGRNSVLCETALENVCLLMRCRDPKTRVCMERHHGAARGTKCGNNKWCIDGLCVPKRYK